MGASRGDKVERYEPELEENSEDESILDFMIKMNLPHQNLPSRTKIITVCLINMLFQMLRIIVLVFRT